MNGYGNFLFHTRDGGVLVHEPRTEILHNGVCVEDNYDCERSCGRSSVNNDSLLILIILLLLTTPGKSDCNV